MIAAAWRQQRPVAFVALGVVIVFAIWLAVTGTMQENAWAAFRAAGNGPCVVLAGSSCARAAAHYNLLNHLSTVSAGTLYALPVLLGLVLGAPLVAREIEQRTNRMAWTQSITRTRWLLLKLSVGATTVVVLVGGLAPLVEWWTSATHRDVRIVPTTFDIVGVVPIAYALFAFALGAALGAIIRRSAWAFAAGVPIYAGVRLVIRQYVRPGLLSPSATASTSGNSIANAWVTNAGYVPLGRLSPAAGQSWQSGEEAIANCTTTLTHPATSSAQFEATASHAWSTCASRAHVHLVTQFQPSSHFWPLQFLELAIFLGAALALFVTAGLAVQWWRT